MTIRRALFVLAVPDLARSAAFYRDVLGFEVRDIGDPGWRVFARDDCLIMAGECPGAVPARDIGEHAYFAYLVVDSADAYHQRAVSAGAEIVKPLSSEAWGMREFGLRTADGHRIMIAEDLNLKGTP